MTAEYKTRVKIGDKGNGLIALTIRTERHLFIDRDTIEAFAAAVEGEGNPPQWLDLLGTFRAFFAKFGEGPPPSALGLESPWSPLPDASADQLLSKYYSGTDSNLRVSLSNYGPTATMLFAAGAASTEVSVPASELSDAIVYTQKVKTACEEAQAAGTDRSKAAEVIGAIKDVAVQTAGIKGAATACAEAAAVAPGGGWGKAAACAGAIALALSGFADWLDAMSKKAEQDAEAARREMDTVGRCDSDFTTRDMDQIDRVNRTA